MEKLNNSILRTLFWIINIAIAVIVVGSIIFGIIESGDVFRAVRGTRGFGPVTSGGIQSLVLGGIIMRIIYIAGLVYILVLVNKILYSIIQGHVYEVWHLRYMRRIGFLVLLAPVPALVMVLMASMAVPVAPGGIMILIGGISYLPYSIVGLVILAIAEVYKAGIAYKQELDLTV